MKFLLLAFSLCLPFLASAQPTATNAEYIKEIEAKVREIQQTYAELPQSKNKEKMLSYFSKDYLIDRVRISLDERVEQSVNTIVDLEKLVNVVTNTPNMKIDYKIDEIMTTYASATVGYCMFKASYDVQRDGKPYVKGREIITYFLQKFNDEWKVVRAHSMQVRDQITRSSCPCNIYKSQAEDKSYIATTDIPEGDVFAKKLNTFTFETLPNGFKMIDVDGQKFSWGSDGKITVIATGPGQTGAIGGKEIGVGKKPVDAMMIILRDYLYPNNCSAIKLSK